MNFLRSLVAVVLVAALIVLPVSCTPGQITKAVDAVKSFAQGVQANLPGANALLADLKVINPEAASYLQPIADQAPAALQKVVAACDAYSALPGSDTYQSILNIVDAFTGQIDQAALKIAGIKNKNSQDKAVAFIAIFSTAAHLALTLLRNHASGTQINAVPKTPQVAMRQMREFIDRDRARQLLTAAGYGNADALLRTNGF